MFGSTIKVKVDKSLYEKLVRIAEAGGYASTDEFITHVLERESSKIGDSADEVEVEKQLRGLGYIE